MTNSEDQGKKTKLTLKLKSPVKSDRPAAPSARQGSGSTVTVEIKPSRGRKKPAESQTPATAASDESSALDGLTDSERQSRLKALEHAEISRSEEIEKEKLLEESIAERKRQEEEEATKRAEEDKKREEERKAKEAAQPEPEPEPVVEVPTVKTTQQEAPQKRSVREATEEDRNKKPGKSKRTQDQKLRTGKLTLSQLTREETRVHSHAATRRRQLKRKKEMSGEEREAEKVIRDVVIPETITVQELSNRMAERVGNVVKSLMNMGVMASASQTIDGDTAEIIVEEFGHKIQRVTEADIEKTILEDKDDETKDLQPRPPVVTIMGHVDHGKTSLLDALRATDVAAGEAGGITQHIGAYQVSMPGGQKISFIDTPGHAAFTAMRSRGAQVTDIVILVVAADDGIMEQTIEAINHAKAAEVPIIVAVNKIDKPGADPSRVYNELLNHEIIVEPLGGDIMAIEISAKQRTNLDKLEEAILLQAEIMELKANPDRAARGVVIEARKDKAKGTVTTLLVQKGTLKKGDLIIAGQGFGHIRALRNDKGQILANAGPSKPVEILGLDVVPEAGEIFSAVDSEKKAREIIDFRIRRERDLKAAAATNKGTIEELFKEAASGVKELPIIIKADVQGSVEAISGSLSKLPSDEVKIKILHSGAGAITESDAILAEASRAVIVGFNVRANAQAKEYAQNENVDIRYYSVIYDLVDDIKSILSGLLTPTQREQYLGNAEIRQVFNLSKFGKIAGCYVTDGVIKRGAGVRLLRDNVVIHEGKLKTLKRFKDDVKEVATNFECGAAFENYDDLKEGDVIEAYEIIEEKREIE